jgi:apolipoprotein N-acyltransferase
VSPPAESAPLAPGRRLLGTAGAAALAFLASPGVSGADGSLVLAVLATGLWAATVARPLGPRPARGLAAEWLGGTLGGALMMWWVSHIVVFGVLYIGGGFGVYAVAMGALVRRLARRLALPLAVGVAWTGVELVRALLPPPFGLGWFRLGFYTHAHTWLAGGARVFGIEGLSFVVAALGGGLAALLLSRRVRVPDALAALLPLAVVALAARLVPVPITRDGPRVLLVQPGFTQQRKQHSDPRANLEFSLELTHRAAAAVGPVDLVCWGESMLYAPLFTHAAEAAIRAGTARALPWDELWTAEQLDEWRAFEEGFVAGTLMTARGGPRRFPEGASFAVGGDTVDLVGGILRRRGALVLYDASGGRSAPAAKQHLVPLGETFFGLERFGWVRALAMRSAGYVPDLVPGRSTGVLELRARDGRGYRVSGTVCFDNAHPWPYVSALRAGPVDFHLVVSNEAWFGTSCEMDQMVAFSRVLALMTGRSFVRATNSGVSLVLGPDGRELGRARDATGADRAVAAFGAWDVPVPLAGDAGATPYSRAYRLLEGLWLAALVLAALVARPGNRPRMSG